MSNYAKEPHISLVRLYDCPDFNGVRHIGFGSWDGAALMSVWDLSSDSVLTPARIEAAYIATDKPCIENQATDCEIRTPNRQIRHHNSAFMKP